MHEINIKWVHKKIGEKTMKNKKTLKFYIAIFIAKCASFTLKLLKRNATYMPGKIALQLCPDFLGMLEKPETIIGVTGTNGKTTVCNMINDILTENKYDFINKSIQVYLAYHNGNMLKYIQAKHKIDNKELGFTKEMLAKLYEEGGIDEKDNDAVS